jgi:transcriptional regulator
MKVDRELSLEEQEKLLTMRAQGISGQEIADHFNAEKGTAFNSQDILDFVNKRKHNAIKVMQQNGQIEDRLAKSYFNSIDQLNRLNRDVWDAFTKIKNSEEYKQSLVVCPKCGSSVKVAFKSAAELVKVSDHLLKQIEHVDKVLNRLKSTGLTINYNVTELTQQINKVLPDILYTLDKKGDIKIKRKKLLRKEEKKEEKKEEVEEEVTEEEVTNLQDSC